MAASIQFIRMSFLAALLMCFSSISLAESPDTSNFKSAKSNLSGTYQLGIGDRIRLIVFNEEDLSGTFTVDDSGQLSLPLIGQVPAAGSRVKELENEIVAAFKQGYLRNPRVSVEILQYRPFYISGEVEADGEYPYVVGLTVPQAIATAGGYTRRANKKTCHYNSRWYNRPKTF